MWTRSTLIERVTPDPAFFCKPNIGRPSTPPVGKPELTVATLTPSTYSVAPDVLITTFKWCSAPGVGPLAPSTVVAEPASMARTNHASAEPVQRFPTVMPNCDTPPPINVMRDNAVVY